MSSLNKMVNSIQIVFAIDKKKTKQTDILVAINCYKRKNSASDEMLNPSRMTEALSKRASVHRWKVVEETFAIFLVLRDEERLNS